MEVTRKSMFTGKMNTMDIPITQEQLDSMVFTGVKWTVPGILIQDAFPNLSMEHREFLMTGTTPVEWDEAFGRDE